MAVPVRFGADFTPEAPQLVTKGCMLPLPSTGRHYDVSGDGQRFLLFKEAPTTDGQKAASPEIHVVLNWTEELKRQYRRSDRREPTSSAAGSVRGHGWTSRSIGCYFASAGNGVAA